MNYKILLTDESRLDIFDAFVWYESQQDGLGFDFELRLEAGLNYISQNPATVQIRYDSVRVYFIHRFPYGIHYTIEGELVRVFGVINTHKNPKEWTDRLNA